MKKHKILVVEDEKTLAQALLDKLTRAGFDVMAAYNGEEGLSKVKSEKPDLVLLDIVMPVMDGLTMLTELRKTSQVPVIILTNLSSEESLSDAMSGGSYEYLVKSNYSLDEVIERINNTLNK